MCEFLVRVVDKVNPNDPYLDVQCLKRGDVVAVVPDGHVWGREELSAAMWRIVKCPGLPEIVAAAFVAPEPELDPQNPSRMNRRRAFAFDVDSLLLPAPMRTWINDSTRAQPSWTLNLTSGQLLALKKSKVRLTDPNTL